MRHAPSIPLSACLLRSLNVDVLPSKRSRIVDETSALQATDQTQIGRAAHDLNASLSDWQ